MKTNVIIIYINVFDKYKIKMTIELFILEISSQVFVGSNIF